MERKGKTSCRGQVEQRWKGGRGYGALPGGLVRQLGCGRKVTLNVEAAMLGDGTAGPQAGGTMGLLPVWILGMSCLAAGGAAVGCWGRIGQPPSPVRGKLPAFGLQILLHLRPLVSIMIWIL